MHRHNDPTPHRPHTDPRRPRRRRRWVGVPVWLALAYVATGFYSVQPNERAVVRRCGRALPGLRGPGLHFGLPYGFDRIDRVKVLELKRIGVGMGLSDRAVGRRAGPRQAEGLTGDRNLILISAIVQYRIADARAYLFAISDVPALVESVVASSLSSVIASMNVDDVLTVQRIAIQNEVVRASQVTLDRHGAGVQVTSVSLEGVTPPQEVARAFRDVTSAREDRLRTINEALGYANRLLPKARGEAQRMLLEAEGFSTEVVRKAEGDAERFTKIAAQLRQDRELTAKRLILETMEDVLPRLKKIVVGGGADENLDLGLFEAEQQDTQR